MPSIRANPGRLKRRAASDRPTARQLAKAQKREHIYTTAMRLFDERGYEQTAIDDIAAAAGVPRGTFYFHFPLPEDILLEAVRRGETVIIGRLQALPGKATFQQVLETTAAGFVEAWGARRALLPYAGTVSLRRIAAVAVERDSDPLRSELARRIGAAQQRRGQAAVLPDQVMADLFLMNIFAGLMAWGSKPDLGLDQVIPALIGFYLHGVEGPGGVGE